MIRNEIINFSVKNLSGEKQKEPISINLKVPSYYASKEQVDKTNYIIYRAFHTQANNLRQGTHNTKTRAEVRGGGRKPWQQKGSGRARAGSTRSPLWKGGGVSFGPKPKIYSNKINRKEWRLGLRLLLLKKQDIITVVEDLNIQSTKTKDLVKTMANLGTKSSLKTVIIVPKINENLRRPSKNLKNVKILQANSLNIKDLLITKSIILTKESLKIMEKIYSYD